MSNIPSSTTRQEMPDYKSLFFTQKEVREILNISQPYLYYGLKCGAIPSITFQNKFKLIPKLEFIRWYDTHWNDSPLFPPAYSTRKRVKRDIPIGEALENLIIAIFGEGKYPREHIRSKIIQHVRDASGE